MDYKTMTVEQVANLDAAGHKEIETEINREIDRLNFVKSIFVGGKKSSVVTAKPDGTLKERVLASITTEPKRPRDIAQESELRTTFMVFCLIWSRKAESSIRTKNTLCLLTLRDGVGRLILVSADMQKILR